ncbi:ribonuclease Y [Candidatus Peregrinibacteria bacterium CG_4_9_14_0_2_um_filter_53_11]|nr:MAG: ribonuclease Y [Candidatus Peregrinibacteria bacterium CG_4_9_14_0_2_um_filter_53_11]
MTPTILIVIGIIAGGIGGFLYRKYQVDAKNREAIERSERTLNEAQSRSKELLLEAKNEALRIQEDAKRQEREKRRQLEKVSERMVIKEDQLEKKLEESEKMREELEKRTEHVKELKEEAEKLHGKQREQLEQIASLSQTEARDLLFKNVEEEMHNDLVIHIKKLEEEEKKTAKDKARSIIGDAIQRYAAEVAAESTATIVPLPSDDMKGRIIGKEGRNINAFEQATGVDVIVDDTPGSIVISGFDPMRRHIAKVALERLIADGRIHPGRIEETVEKAKKEVNELIRELGEKAAYETGVVGLPPNLIKLLGRLHFRVSFGQNVLKHSIQVSFLAGALANEIGGDAALCRKAGLLHAVGKAVDHEIGGHYTQIGRDILKKFGLPQEIIHAVEAQNGDPEAKSIEAALVSAAVAISQARPGASKDNLDTFIRRMEEMENLIKGFDGVERVFALQAGSEVRIIVNPEKINDLEMLKLSHSIGRKIETDLKFPGQVKISMFREVRGEAYAE